MKKWNLIVDVSLCENCNNCVLATKDEHVGNDFPGYAAPQPLHGHEWIQIKQRARGAEPMVDVAYLPTTCNHCDAAPCVEAAGGEAVYQRRDGIVIIDPKKATGRRDLVKTCPYGAIWWNEQLQLPQKWIFDAHLLDQGWPAPRCVQACPTGALSAVQLEDGLMQQRVREEKLETLHPHLNTKPRVWYRNLYRYSKCFIGGSVTATRGGVEECLPGARAVVRMRDRAVAEAVTDVFGDFKCDGFDRRSGPCRIEVSHPQFGTAVREVEVRSESIYLDRIRLGGN